MKRFFIAGLFGLISTVMFLSCRTLPKFNGEGDLCGLIVDEKNAPVKDFLIYCKNDLEIKTALTDASGMFVIHGVSSGAYKISGKKKNFVRLSDTDFLFNDRSKIFCCQVQSADGAFDAVEQLMLRGEERQALDVLENLYCDKKTPQEAVILTYRFFLSEKNKEKKKLVDSLRKIGRYGESDYEKYAVFLEELIDEK